MELDLIYDKIYRYVYFRVHDQELAEDITQEAFLRHMEKKGSMADYEMRYLYAIAKNLCVDEFRRVRESPIPEGYEASSDFSETEILRTIALQKAVSELDSESQELLLLRYVNEESVVTISKLYDCSRFALYRKIRKAEKKLREILEVSIHE